MTVASILGGRMIREYKGYSVGTWTDTVSAGNATQATAAKKPAVLSLPNGQSYPDFDGVTGAGTCDALVTPAFSGLPAWNTTHNQIWGCLLRCDSINLSSNIGWVWCNSTWFVYVDGSIGNTLYAGGMASDASIVDGLWRRIICARNGGTGIATMYVNGAAQAATLSGTWGDNWNSIVNEPIGDRDGSGDYGFNGGLAEMFWGYDTTTSFTADIANLDAALAAMLVGQTAASGPTIAFRSGRIFDGETGSR